MVAAWIIIMNMAWFYLTGFNGLWFTIILTAVFLTALVKRR